MASGVPVVIATNGIGLAVRVAKKTDNTPTGTPMTVSSKGRGRAVVIVSTGGLPVFLMDEAGAAYVP